MVVLVLCWRGGDCRKVMDMVLMAREWLRSSGGGGGGGGGLEK